MYFEHRWKMQQILINSQKTSRKKNLHWQVHLLNRSEKMRTVTQRDNRLADKRVAAANHSQRAVVWSCGWQAAANHVVAANTCTWTPECCYSPQRHWHLCICCMLMQTLVGVWNNLKHTNLHTNTDTDIYVYICIWW